MRCYACELTEKDIGRNVAIEGWLHNTRNMGGLLFMLVRDCHGEKTGECQVVVKDEAMQKEISAIPTESVIRVEGEVVLRESPNPKMFTGMIEILPERVTILNKRLTEALPFEIYTSKNAKESSRLQYRFLDLRNPEVRKFIFLRQNVIRLCREIMYRRGFIEFNTPILTCSSPEGARDYIVPSRNYPGKFYALPQAPQQYKQLIMASGFEKYFQIAPCFRDEDARADRSPGEFYQLDIEMSFVTQEDIFNELEAILPEIFLKLSSPDFVVPMGAFPRITYNEAMEKYGSDKPDLRNPLIIQDISDIAGGAFEAFKGQTVKAVAVKDFKETRKFIDATANFIKEQSDKVMYWCKLDDAGNLSGGLAKHLESVKDALVERLGLTAGSFVAIVAGAKGKIEKTAGLLRAKLGKDLDLLEKNIYKFCWIIDFPMYEADEETGAIGFSHNPFSMPQGGMDALLNKHPLDIYAYQYDIVCNGVELSSGAVRNHDPEIMLKAFEIAGLSKKDIESKFSALFNAFHYGAPPHAGIAPGIDRMAMLIGDLPTIRECILFPMNPQAQDLLMNAPSEVSEQQLKDVHISVVYPKEKK